MPLFLLKFLPFLKRFTLPEGALKMLTIGIMLLMYVVLAVLVYHYRGKVVDLRGELRSLENYNGQLIRKIDDLDAGKKELQLKTNELLKEILDAQAEAEALRANQTEKVKTIVKKVYPKECSGAVNQAKKDVLNFLGEKPDEPAK